MEKLVQKIVLDIAPEELEKIKSVGGLAILAIKIIEKAHKKKNLSYEDSKKLVDSVIDILLITIEGRHILESNQDLKTVVNSVKENRQLIREVIDDGIDIWDSLKKSGWCDCCLKKKNRSVTKSHPQEEHGSQSTPV
jgi:hypothetical protein